MRPVTDVLQSCVVLLVLWVAGDLTSQILAQGAAIAVAGPWAAVLLQIYEKKAGFVCTKDEFACTHAGPCIPYNWTCDTVNDCPKGQDEIFHTPLKGADGLGPRGAAAAWRFGIGSKDGYCDQVNDCVHPHQFKCKRNGEQWCMPKKWTCDSLVDCDDGEDEMTVTTPGGADCPDPAVMQKKCPGENEFECPSKNRYNSTKDCIPQSWVCDMIPDCTDEEDEDVDLCVALDNKLSEEICLGKNQFQCRTIKKCVSAIVRCDAFDDCGDLSDEAGCPYCYSTNETDIFAVFNYTEENGTVSQYAYEGFECSRNKSVGCIAIDWVCDSVNDCGNATVSEDENEADCVAEYGTDKSKWPNIFTCDNLNYTSKAYVCDNANDCGDWSDEKNCTCNPKATPDECGISATCQDETCEKPCNPNTCKCKPEFIYTRPNGKKTCLKSLAGSRAEVIQGSATVVMLMTALALSFLDGGIATTH